jgi:hypothetical protein
MSDKHHIFIIEKNGEVCDQDGTLQDWEIITSMSAIKNNCSGKEKTPEDLHNAATQSSQSKTNKLHTTSSNDCGRQLPIFIGT